MGGLCSRRSTADSTIGRGLPHVNGHYSGGIALQAHSSAVQPDSNLAQASGGEDVNKQPREPFSFPELNVDSHGTNMNNVYDGIPRLPRASSNKYGSTRSTQAAIAKVAEMSSLLGKAGTAGIGKAVDVLDTLGSSMTNLSPNSGFASGMVTKGIKISILAFEVANTIVKGANLMHSLDEDNIKHLKDVVVPSEGVQKLISKDRDELLSIAAADKREELKIYSAEVVRFGNRCKDPQWHNLDRYFAKLESELSPHRQLKEEALTVMNHLMNMVQYTAELYHEMHALDRFQQDYNRKLQEEENPSATPKGDSLAILRAELKSQKKHVKGLKKKSLWSKVLEEVMEKLVDIVHYLHLEIHASFGSADGHRPTKNTHQKLGSAGLALHYANVISQIDTLVTRSSSVPQSTRDSLYQGLPPNVKASLRSKLQSFHGKEEFTIPQIKAEMEKTLQWIVPMATNTTKAHHGFGWVGEWANTGSDINRKSTGQLDLLRIETLYHANKDKTEACILELVVWLHFLVSQYRASADSAMRSPVKSPIRSPNQTTIRLSSQRTGSPCSTLSVEDQEMLRDVSKRKLTPGISKSQEFETGNSRLSKHHRLSKSSNHSPTSERQKDPFPVSRPSSVPLIHFDIDRVKALDVIDRVDTVRGV